MAFFGFPPWVVMWIIATAIFFVCKLFTLRGVRAPWWRRLLYVIAWPGMDARAFCTSSPPATPASSELLFAVVKTAFGMGLLFVVVPSVEPLLLRGWVGMIGVIFTLHFGLFHITSWCWRRAGVVARPLMDWPVLATSLADFWGRRWNTAFRDLTHRFLFRPLTTHFGSKNALVLGFLASGVVHDLVISVPAGGGYGLPTLYFVLQGVGLLIERAVPKLRGRLFTFVVLIIPSYWLFHPPFVLTVIVPFLDWLQDPTLTPGIS